MQVELIQGILTLSTIGNQLAQTAKCFLNYFFLQTKYFGKNFPQRNVPIYAGEKITAAYFREDSLKGKPVLYHQQTA